MVAARGWGQGMVDGDAGKASEWIHRDTSKSKGPSPSLRDGLFNEMIGQEMEQLAVIL